MARLFFFRTGRLLLDEGLAEVYPYQGATLTGSDIEEIVRALAEHASPPVPVLLDRRPRFEVEFNVIESLAGRLLRVAAGLAFLVEEMPETEAGARLSSVPANADEVPVRVFADRAEARAWLRDLVTDDE